MALRYTHVSIPTRDADQAALWYQSLFSLEEIAAPNFGFNVRWFRVGDLQLHLYERNEARAPMQHFGLAVDDFEGLYRKAQQIGAFDTVRAHHLYITAAGEVQLYLRDPDGNNIEVNWPDASTLPSSIRDEAIRREDQFAQSERNRSARIFMAPQPAA
jgi:catechol 2,3-dioxygenase-like lactoylglutathione lyase family enzyme